MKTIQFVAGFAAAALFFTGGPAFAKDKKDEGGKKERPAVAAKGGGGQRVQVSKGGGGHKVEVAWGGDRRDFTGYKGGGGKALSSTGGKHHDKSGSYAGSGAALAARGGNSRVVAGARNVRGTSFARGGSVSRWDRKSDRGHYKIAFREHDGWSHDREYDWEGHHYGWYGDGWVIIDNGPGYYGGYQPGYAGYGGSVESQVQAALAQQGYYDGPVDGLVGPGTRAAIASYQRDNGLRVTGFINDSLLAALGLG